MLNERVFPGRPRLGRYKFRTTEVHRKNIQVFTLTSSAFTGFVETIFRAAADD